MARQSSRFFVILPGETRELHITKSNIRRLTMLTGDPSGLEGQYNYKYYGDCTNIHGRISGLTGDISKLRGDVSGIRGYCTGVDIDCTGLIGDIRKIYLLRIEEEKFKKGGLYLSKHKFLTNADNQKLWDVWLKIANSTIGLTDDEYKQIEKPIKNTPPFPVDVWGRHYVPDSDGGVICFSINPADILLLRTNQAKQTCWSIYDKNNARLRMRLLLARACINPSVGVCFKINSISKFNIFKKLPFNYYKHSLGTFFQYNNTGLQTFGEVGIDITNWFEKVYGEIKPFVVGHDAHNNLGHAGQDKLMFYEKYMKDDFSLWHERCPLMLNGCEHVLSNFQGCVFLDKDFNVIKKFGDDLSAEFITKSIENLKKRIETGVFDEKV